MQFWVSVNQNSVVVDSWYLLLDDQEIIASFQSSHILHTHTAMNRHYRPRRPPPTFTGTAPDTLKHAARVFSSYPHIFLLLSLIVFFIHSDVHAAVHNLSSRINREPSLQSLFYRTYSTDAPRLYRRHESEGMSEGFDSVSVFNRFYYGAFSRKPIPPNTTLATLDPDYGFSDHSIGIRIVKPGAIGFKTGFEDNNNINSSSSGDVIKGSWVLNFLIEGFESGPNIPSSFSLSTVYAYGLLALICTHYCINGIIFLTVMDDSLGHYRSFVRRIWYGWRIGMRSEAVLILIKWGARAMLAHLIAIYVFRDMEDEYLFLRVFMWIKFMPFPCLAPVLNTGHAWDTAGFMVVWLLVDFEVGLALGIESSVSVMKPRWGYAEMIAECYYMLGALFYPACVIKLLEAMGCGSVGKWILLEMMPAEFVVRFIQATMEVYFKIAWVVFHLAAIQEYWGIDFTRQDFQLLLDDVFDPDSD